MVYAKSSMYYVNGGNNERKKHSRQMAEDCVCNTVASAIAENTGNPFAAFAFLLVFSGIGVFVFYMMAFVVACMIVFIIVCVILCTTSRNRESEAKKQDKKKEP